MHFLLNLIVLYELLRQNRYFFLEEPFGKLIMMVVTNNPSALTSVISLDTVRSRQEIIKLALRMNLSSGLKDIDIPFPLFNKVKTCSEFVIEDRLQ